MKRIAVCLSLFAVIILLPLLSGCKSAYECPVRNVYSGYTWYETYQAKDADEAWGYCQDDWGYSYLYTCYSCYAQ